MKENLSIENTIIIYFLKKNLPWTVSFYNRWHVIRGFIKTLKWLGTLDFKTLGDEIELFLSKNLILSLTKHRVVERKDRWENILSEH